MEAPVRFDNGCMARLHQTGRYKRHSWAVAGA